MLLLLLLRRFSRVRLCATPQTAAHEHTGVGCRFLQCREVKSESEVSQSCLTLSDPMDCSPPGSSSMGFSRQECRSGVPLPSPQPFSNANPCQGALSDGPLLLIACFLLVARQVLEGGRDSLLLAFICSTVILHISHDASVLAAAPGWSSPPSLQFRVLCPLWWSLHYTYSQFS